MSYFDSSPGDRLYQPYAYEVLAPTSATALTASKYKPADEQTNGRAQVIIISTDAAAAYRIDGAADPTTASGIYMGANDTHRIRGYVSISQLKVISASGHVSITYLR